VKLIVGLGNPGRLYRYTRHNVGFLAIEGIAKDHRIKVRTKRYGAVLGTGKIGQEPVMLLMPVTYMNLSGKAVKDAIDAEGIDLKDLLVICDDINLRLGSIRMRTRGSAGGHRGLVSIIEELGSDGFARLRAGIATDVVKGDITQYVLSPFRKKELKKIKEVTVHLKDAVSLWVKGGADVAMGKYNVRNRTYG